MIVGHSSDKEGEESSSFQDDTLKNGSGGSVKFSPPHSSTSGTPPSTYNSSAESINSQKGTDNNNTSQFAFIDNDGICTTCKDASAHETSLTCLLCKSQFHAVCKDADKDRTKGDVICNRSFYNTFVGANTSKINMKRFGTFTFVCDECMTRLEQNKKATTESKVDVIDKRVDNLSKSIDNMKELLMKAIDTKTHVEPNISKPLFSEVVEKPRNRSVVIMSSQVAENKDKDIKHVDKIIQENAIHADKRYVNKNGDIVVVCPTTTDRENLVKKVSQELPEIKTHKPPDRLPTISIANLTEKYTEDTLLELLLQAHPDIKDLKTQGETISVLKVKPQIKNSDKCQATIRVSNNIRRIIERQGDRLYIGSNSFKVYDQFHVKRCNKCQGFGHYKQECKSEKTVCGYCSEHHLSEDCTHRNHNGFIPCCSNCKKSKFDDQKTTHTAFDRGCPSYITEQKQLRKTINYYNSKN